MRLLATIVRTRGRAVDRDAHVDESGGVGEAAAGPAYGGSSAAVSARSQMRMRRTVQTSPVGAS